MGDLLAARILGGLGRRLLGDGAGLIGSVGSKAARDGFLDRAAGYERPPQPVQHGAGVLRAVFRALGDEPADEALEHGVAAGRLGRGLGNVACPEGRGS